MESNLIGDDEHFRVNCHYITDMIVHLFFAFQPEKSEYELIRFYGIHIVAIIFGLKKKRDH